MSSTITAIRTDGAPLPIGPYCQATKHKGIIYSTGCIALDPKTQEVVAGGIAEQARRTMLNAKALLHASGSSFDSVLQVALFLKDLGDFADFNTVYAEFFTKEIKPARSCVEVSRLPKDVLCEMQFVAVEEESDA